MTVAVTDAETDSVTVSGADPDPRPGRGSIGRNAHGHLRVVRMAVVADGTAAVKGWEGNEPRQQEALDSGGPVSWGDAHERHGGHHDADPDGLAVREEYQALRPAAWSVTVAVAVTVTETAHKAATAVLTLQPATVTVS